MEIRLKFFASVREALDVSDEKLSVPDGMDTVGAVRALLQQRGGVWADALSADKPLRMAFNHVMCGPETALEADGEVAFFPPVTGG